MNVEFVGINRTLHHGFTQAIRGGDKHHVVKTGFGIDGEHHARCAGIGTHHALDAGGQRHFTVREALVYAIGNGAVVVERCKHVFDRDLDVIQAMNVEEGFLLAGKRGIRQVFGCCRGTHRNRDFGAGIGNHLGIGVSHFMLEFGREWGIDDPLTNLRADFGQGGHVVDVQCFQRVFDPLRQTFVLQEITVSLCGCRKATGNAYAGTGQLADHLAERGVFAANLLNVGHAQLFEPNDVIVCHLKHSCKDKNVKAGFYRFCPGFGSINPLPNGFFAPARACNNPRQRQLALCLWPDIAHIAPARNLSCPTAELYL